MTRKWHLSVERCSTNSLTVALSRHVQSYQGYTTYRAILYYVARRSSSLEMVSDIMINVHAINSVENNFITLLLGVFFTYLFYYKNDRYLHLLIPILYPLVPGGAGLQHVAHLLGVQPQDAFPQGALPQRAATPGNHSSLSVLITL